MNEVSENQTSMVVVQHWSRCCTSIFLKEEPSCDYYTGRTLQISILIMNLQKPRKYDVVKSSVFPLTGNVQNGISELKRHQ